ncbi:MAG: cupin domain-containing protein [Chloroflexi bacterium]|nr:MAG: cupin domain-containing protein [Chloroflexota bacterium]
MRVTELLDRLQVIADRADVRTALGLREHETNAHRPSIGWRAYRRRVEIEERIRTEARDVYSWSNGPGDRYGEHAHLYNKLLYCTRGSIDFRLRDGKTIHLEPGDRMVLPSGTAHSAVVGPTGCTCIEGKLPD